MPAACVWPRLVAAFVGPSVMLSRAGLRAADATRTKANRRSRGTKRTVLRSTVNGPAPVAQGIERRFPKPCVAGSNPAGGATKSLVRGPPGTDGPLRVPFAHPLAHPWHH